MVETTSRATVRHDGRLHHIGLGVEHRGVRVIILAHDLEVRVAHRATGELIRKLTIEPATDYQPLGRPPGPKPRRRPR